MKVRIDFIKEELTKDSGTGCDVALQLAARAISFKLRQDKESNRGEAIVVWINVHQPAVPV